MIVYCSICGTAYLVQGGMKGELTRLLNRPEWESSFPCVTPMCKGRLMKVNHTWLKKIGKALRATKHVPLHSFYRAINGFGMADGDPAPMAKVKELLLTKKIVDVQAEEIGQPKRTIIRQLILEDGTRLHFDRSNAGACLYYVEQPGPTCLEVFDGELDGDAACPDEVRAESGEEARRDPEAAEGGQARSAAAGAEVPGSGLPAVQPDEAVLPDSGDGN